MNEMPGKPATLRRREYEWAPPGLDPALVKSLSGLELLQCIADGRLPGPSIGPTMNFRAARFEHGRAMFEGETAEFLYNPLGTVHGGFAATLLDSALGCAVHSTLKAGIGYTTVELKVNYVRALRADVGLVRAEAEVIHVGARLGTSEGKLIGVNDGKLYAHGSTTCMIFPL